MDRFSNYREFPTPITNEMLDDSCLHCRSSQGVKGLPTDQCKHFHTLSEENFINDHQWYDAPLCNILHKAGDNVLEMRLRQWARSKGQILLKWRCPTSENAACIDMHESITPIAHMYPLL